MQQPGLAFALLRASDWFNDALVVELEERGWPRLNRTQSLTFANLDAGGVRPVELARRVGISRQSMQQLLRELAAEDLVTLADDPADRRAKLVRLTDDGRRLVRDARTILRRLERRLAQRLGEPAVQDLRAALAADWGSAR